MNQGYNLVLSGGGVRSYAHIGVYKYCYENNIVFNEIVSVSGGSLIAPFIYLRKEPDKVISLFKKANIHRLLFPFWFMPDKFECLLIQPSTLKIGKWLEEQFTQDELNLIHSSNTLHIMATKSPACGIKAMYTNMLEITDMKNAVSASCAISGIFKEHKVGKCSYIDGGHWDNCPVFFNFKDNCKPLIVSNLGYTGLTEKPGGRISQIIRGLEISSFARVQEDIERWLFEKDCKKRGDLFVINSPVWNIKSLDFNLKDFQITEMIKAGYNAAQEIFKSKLTLEQAAIQAVL